MMSTSALPSSPKSAGCSAPQGAGSQLPLLVALAANPANKLFGGAAILASLWVTTALVHPALAQSEGAKPLPARAIANPDAIKIQPGELQVGGTITAVKTEGIGQRITILADSFTTSNAVNGRVQKISPAKSKDIIVVTKSLPNGVNFKVGRKVTIIGVESGQIKGARIPSPGLFARFVQIALNDTQTKTESYMVYPEAWTEILSRSYSASSLSQPEETLTGPVMPPAEGLATQNDILIKEYSNHPIAAEGYAIPAVLQNELNIIAFKDLQRDPNRIYQRFEKLVPFRVGPENESPAARLGAAAELDKFLGIMLAFIPNVADRTVYDKTGQYDRDSFYLNSLTIWNESDNKPVTGGFAYDKINGNVGLVMAASDWSQLAGKILSVRATMTVSTINASLINAELRRGAAAVEADYSGRVRPVKSDDVRPVTIPQGSFFTDILSQGIDPKRRFSYEPDLRRTAEDKKLIKDSPAWDEAGNTAKAVTIIKEMSELVSMNDHPPGRRLATNVIKGVAGDCGSSTIAINAIASMSKLPYRLIYSYTKIGETEDSGASHMMAEFLTDFGPVPIDLTKVNTKLGGTESVNRATLDSLSTVFRYARGGEKNVSFRYQGLTGDAGGFGSVGNIVFKNREGRLCVRDLQPDFVRSKQLPVE